MSPRARRWLLGSAGTAAVFAVFCIVFVQVDTTRRLYSHCTACGMEHYKTYLRVTIFGSSWELENGMQVNGSNSTCPHSIVHDM